tara:strand:- start:386 stop:1264 length:879 start_codon:yes stop_codon:yes gene_type:complete
MIRKKYLISLSIITQKNLYHLKQKKRISKNIISEKILSINQLKVWYPIKKGILRRTVDYVKAVDSLDFNLHKGQTLGVVGESGSGKTSLVLSLLKLISSEGNILFNNINLNQINNKKMNSLRKDFQIVFQDPFSSLSPRMTIEQIISEGLNIHEKNLTENEKSMRIKKVLVEVGMDYENIKERFPHEFSGGQRQRISIARALVLTPKLIIFDEPTSALDVNIQAQILDMLSDIQKEKQLSYIFISHDMKIIRAMSDNIIVINNGKIVEEGDANTIFNFPKSDYTKKLIQSVI